MPMQPAASAMSNWPRTNLEWALLGKGRGAGAKLQLSSNAGIYYRHPQTFVKGERETQRLSLDHCTCRSPGEEDPSDLAGGLLPSTTPLSYIEETATSSLAPRSPISSASGDWLSGGGFCLFLLKPLRESSGRCTMHCAPSRRAREAGMLLDRAAAAELMGGILTPQCR